MSGKTVRSAFFASLHAFVCVLLSETHFGYSQYCFLSRLGVLHCEAVVTAWTIAKILVPWGFHLGFSQRPLRRSLRLLWLLLQGAGRRPAPRCSPRRARRRVPRAVRRGAGPWWALGSQAKGPSAGAHATSSAEQLGGGLANCSACCILKNRGLKWEVLRVVGPSARSGLGAGARDAARLAGRAANRLNL